MSDRPPFAEYPRPNGGTGLYSGRGPGVYFEAIGESWNVVRQDIGTWIAATVVMLVISYAVMLPFVPFYLSAMASLQRSNNPAGIVPLLGSELLAGGLFFVAQGMMLAGMIGLGVRKLRGEYINVGMIFDPFRSFGRMIGVLLLNAVVVGAAYAACFLPALYFYPVLMLMPTVAYLRGLGPVASLSTTFDACKRYGLGLLALQIVLGLIVGVASVLCFLPVLLAFPIYCVTLAIHYRAFFEAEPAPVPTYG